MTKKDVFYRISGDEFAEFLNHKGASLNTFRCPVCGNESHTLLDCEDVINGETDKPLTPQRIVYQPTLSGTQYPGLVELRTMIEQGNVPRAQYSSLASEFGIIIGTQHYSAPVIHLICDNCSYVRTFRKNKILEYLNSKEDNPNEI